MKAFMSESTKQNTDLLNVEIIDLIKTTILPTLYTQTPQTLEQKQLNEKIEKLLPLDSDFEPSHLGIMLSGSIHVEEKNAMYLQAAQLVAKDLDLEFVDLSTNPADITKKQFVFTSFGAQTTGSPTNNPIKEVAKQMESAAGGLMLLSEIDLLQPQVQNLLSSFLFENKNDKNSSIYVGSTKSNQKDSPKLPSSILFSFVPVNVEPQAPSVENTSTNKNSALR